MSRKKEWTPEQRKFVELAIQYEGMNDTRAYMEAYNIPIEKKETARVNAYKLQQIATIAKAIQEGIAKTAQIRENKRLQAAESYSVKDTLSLNELRYICTEIIRDYKPKKIDGKVILPNYGGIGKMMDVMIRINGWEQNNDGGSQGNITINITNGTANGNKIEKYDSEPDDD